MIVKPNEATSLDMGAGLERTIFLSKESGAQHVTLGTMTLQPHTSFGLHRHSVEDAMLVLDGEGVFVLDDVETTVTKGTALLVPAGHTHTIKNDSEAPFTVVFTYPDVDVQRLPPE